jgi:8-oxo-dGTP diphosphatase
VTDRLEVVAAVLERDGQVLLARRTKDDAIGRVWEFPGGRVEEGESLEDALARELREELGVDAAVGEKLFENEHDYAHLRVRLHFFRCDLVDGEPEGKEGQALVWVRPSELPEMEVPEADRAMVELITIGR